MSIAGLPDWIGKPFAAFLIDILLAGDNALVIALVCRSLPRGDRLMVLGAGTIGAVLMRLLLAGLAGGLLALPALKLVGGLILAVLALNLVRAHPGEPAPPNSLDAQGDRLAAIMIVILFDVLMSLDNVVALAAVAGGDLVALGFGLLMSIAIVMVASAKVADLLHRVPLLARLGAALLGWIAGRMCVSDPLVASFVAREAPALPVVVPLLAGTYVYLMEGTAATTTLAAATAPTLVAGVGPVQRAMPGPAAAGPVEEPSPRAARSALKGDVSEQVMIAAFAAMTLAAGLLLAIFIIAGSRLSGE